MKKIRIIIALMTATLCLLPAAPSYAQNIIDPVCSQIPDPTQSPLCQDNQETRDDNPGDNALYGPDGLVTRVIRILSIVIGVAAVIMVIIGGLRYVMSSGDPNGANAAKNTILYALIGGAVAILAQAIIVFVIGRL